MDNLKCETIACKYRTINFTFHVLRFTSDDSRLTKKIRFNPLNPFDPRSILFFLALFDT
jgi:hypothetical protein